MPTLDDEVLHLYKSQHRDKEAWKLIVTVWCGKSGTMDEMKNTVLGVGPTTCKECLDAWHTRDRTKE